MIKGLDVLKEIKNYEVTYPNHTDKPFMVTPDYPDKNRTITTIGEIFDFDIPLIEKELKALEIIANKKVNVFTLLQCCYDIGKYNAKCSKLQSMLTLDEVNLLKEALL